MRNRIILAFALVYVIWGSTYLAIRFAIETLPPFIMAGGRFMIAGAILYAWHRRRGVPAPTRRQWKSGAIIGACLLLVGNGGLVWAEQRVPSGIAALLIATVPIWMALLDWLLHGATRPSRGITTGLVVGFIGIVLLVGPRGLSGESLDPAGTFAVLLAGFFWALGSLYARRADLPRAPLMGTATEMLAGGAFLLVAGLLTGEATRIAPEHFSMLSVLSFGYLGIFGSLVGYSAYTWLLRVTTTARVSTYAYVNPVVAVILGWAFAGEPLTFQTVISATIIIAAVVLITLNQQRSEETSPPEPVPETA